MIKVAVAGHFDPIHDGHLDHIEKAKRFGDYLVVIVGTEAQAIEKKGWWWLTLEGKKRLLMAFKGLVDEVVVNIDTDGTCAETLRMIKPDIFVKGGDRVESKMPQKELDICKKIGCSIIYGIGDLLNTSSGLKGKLKLQPRINPGAKS